MAVLRKTEKGRDEIRTRAHRLAAKPRMLLMLVDGQVAEDELLARTSALGLPADTLGELMAAGFVETLDAAAVAAAPPPKVAAGEAASDSGPDDRFARYREARGFMTESLAAALGLKAFVFTLRIEKTADLAELRALHGDYIQAMTRALGAQGAQAPLARMQMLLDG